MKFRLSPEITQKIPGFTVAVIVARNINNLKKSSAISQLLLGVCAAKQKELANETKRQKMLGFLKHAHVDHKTLKETQFLESILNKVSKGKDLLFKDNLAGLAYFLALKYLLPLHGNDLDEVEKDIEMDFITPKPGKKAQDIEFGKDTKNAVFWLIDIGSQTKEQFVKLPDECAKIINKYCGGETEIHLLNADQMEVDLNYISEKEKEYAAEEQKKVEQEKLTEKILTSDEAPFLESAGEASPPEKTVKEELEEILADVVKNLDEIKDREDRENLSKVKLETPHEASHGDFAASIALKLAKVLDKNPREVAELIQQKLPAIPLIERTEIAGPGFINFHLAQNYFEQQLEKIVKAKSNYGRLTIGKGKKVLIEYSAPNIAKPLGVHHLLSTIIGQTLVNLYRFGGYEVVALNYPGDWGTQFGKLIYAYKTWGDEETVKKDPLNELLKLYVQFHNEAEKDPTLDDKGRAEFKKLEEGDEENSKLWRWIRDLSLREMERIYQKLDVSFDEYLGEQMYLEPAKKLLEIGKAQGIVVQGENGSFIVPSDNEKDPPHLLQKADGTTLYSTRDLASIQDRLERYKPDELLYVVDVAQSLHFKQLFSTAQKFGFGGPDGPNFTHVVFGRMQLPEGKMSTRKGDVILLDEVIKEAVSRTEKLIEEKSKELPEGERKYVAESMAISAIKYNIISQNRETNMTFEWDRMLSLDGNSGPYLQYACARAQSILRKALEETKAEPVLTEKPKTSAKSKDSQQTSLFSIAEEKAAAEQASAEAASMDGNPSEATTARAEADKNRKPFEHETEKNLLRLLPRFPELIERSIQENKPNLLTTYLFEVARAFSAFYNELPVLYAGTPELKEARLKLVEGVAHVLKNGLGVLGISVFERM